MAVQFRVFQIPVSESEKNEEEFNKFLRSVRAVGIHKEFVSHGPESFWSFAVEYIMEKNQSDFKKDEGEKRRIDYKNILSPEDFTLFVSLREWRKKRAADEGVPVYTIFTNAQLASIVEKKVGSISALKKIDGVGESRIEKYGESVVSIVLDDVLKLRLKENIQINRCEKGLPFLGYRIFPGHIKLVSASKKRFINKFKKYENNFISGKWSEEELSAHTTPLLSFTLLSDSLSLRKDIIKKYGVIF